MKLIVKQILCIKLVNYWDKYTEKHGQQNVEICNSACYGFVVIACTSERACSFDGLSETYSVTAVSCRHHSVEIRAENIFSFCWRANSQIEATKFRSCAHRVLSLSWWDKGEFFPLFYLYISSWSYMDAYNIQLYLVENIGKLFSVQSNWQFAPLLEVKFLVIRLWVCWTS